MSVDTLYIIGNGFDIAHNMPTKYENFREYMQKNAPENMKDRVERLIKIIDKYDSDKNISEDKKGIWSELESYLEKICLKDAEIDLYKDSYFDQEGEEHEIHYTIEEKGEEVHSFEKDVDEMYFLFEEWVDTCSSQEKIKQIDHRINYFTEALRDSNYMILSFNYTDTLEQLYGVAENRICHIHGKCRTQGKYYFGHGKKVPEIKKIGSLRDTIKYTNYLEEDDTISFPDVLISNKLFKDINEAYHCKKAFFDGLSEVQNIYVYGFSFGEVDLFYIRKINEKAPTAVWHIYEYNKCEVDSGTKNKLLKINNDMKIEFWRI